MFEIALIALTVGAVLVHSFGLSLFVIAVCSILFAIGFFLLFPSKRSFIICPILAIICFIGAVRMSLQNSVTPQGLYGERVVVGNILSTDKRLDSTRFVLRDSVYKKNIQVLLYQDLDVLSGDTVQITGVIERPEDFITDTNRLFHYTEYLQSKSISAVANDVVVISIKDSTKSIARFADTIRYSSALIVSTYISFPYDGIVSGMLLGYQGGIPKSTDDLFRATGIVHVVVLSGYNITLLVVFLGIILRRVPQHVRLALIGISVAVLVLISGAGVAGVRAGIMGVIGLLAIATLQKYKPFRALLVTYLLFFLYSPLSIFSDPGFHLSFLATFFIVLIIPKIEIFFHFIPETHFVSIRELVVLAISMPLLLLPYMMYFSGIFPLASIPANILLALITPIVMVGGALVIALSFIAPIAMLLGKILSVVLEIILSLVQLLAHLPIYNTPELSSWGVVIFYGVLFLLLFRKELQQFIVRVQSFLLRQSN